MIRAVTCDTCDTCDRSSPSDEALAQHLRDSPVHAPIFDCDTCDRSFMFPLLHQDVVSAVSDEIASPSFHKDDSDSGAYNRYATHVMGEFKCSNDACFDNGWVSKKVAILIRGYLQNEYNALVFSQRCKSCNELGALKMDDESYVERVAYRLKKWAGVEVERPYFGAKNGLPHKSELCEGCKRGVCQERDSWQYRLTLRAQGRR
jgi:hypothetical protein